MFVVVASPLIFATLAYFLFQNGHGQSLLVAALASGVMGIWSTTTAQGAGALQTQRRHRHPRAARRLTDAVLGGRPADHGRDLGDRRLLARDRAGLRPRALRRRDHDPRLGRVRRRDSRRDRRDREPRLPVRLGARALPVGVHARQPVRVAGVDDLRPADPGRRPARAGCSRCRGSSRRPGACARCATRRSAPARRGPTSRCAPRSRSPTSSRGPLPPLLPSLGACARHPRALMTNLRLAHDRRLHQLPGALRLAEPVQLRDHDPHSVADPARVLRLPRPHSARRGRRVLRRRERARRRRGAEPLRDGANRRGRALHPHAVAPRRLAGEPDRRVLRQVAAGDGERDRRLRSGRSRSRR